MSVSCTKKQGNITENSDSTLNVNPTKANKVSVTTKVGYWKEIGNDFYCVGSSGKCYVIVVTPNVTEMGNINGANYEAVSNDGTTFEFTTFDIDGASTKQNISHLEQVQTTSDSWRVSIQ